MDLLGGAGGLEQARDLVVALLLGGLGEGGVLGGGAGLATDGGLQVVKRGADGGLAAGGDAEVVAVVSGGNLGAYLHRCILLLVCSCSHCFS